MLETLVSLVNLINTWGMYLLYGSYKTGYILVKIFSLMCEYLLIFGTGCLNACSIIWECFLIFLQDNLQFMHQIFALASTSLDIVIKTIAALVYKVYSLCYAVMTFVASSFSAVISGISISIAGIGHAIIFIKKIFILFGSGVWFLITLVPLALYYLCTLVVAFGQRLLQELRDMFCSGVEVSKQSIQNGISFIIDVPIRSAIGIVICLCIIYILAQFNNIFVSIERKARTLRNWYRQTARRNERVSTPAAACTDQERSQLEPGVSKRKLETADDKSCVICQERNRCVLLLPCRHLCLCMECTRELKYYYEICPICRSNINRTMKIYV